MEKASRKSKLTVKNKHYELRKFHILKLLNSYPMDTRQQKINEIFDKTGIKKNTYYNWLNLSIYDSGSISEKHLRTIAEVLEVQPFTALYNLNEPEKEKGE